MNNLSIELHVPDFQVAIDFYKVLGFKVVWVSEEYLVLNRGNTALYFYGGTKEVLGHSYFGNFPKDTKRGYAVEIILYEKNIKELYNRIKDKVKVVEELKLKPWGKWDFRIEDPFGFYLRIGEPDDIVNDEEFIKQSDNIAKKKGLVL